MAATQRGVGAGNKARAMLRGLVVSVGLLSAMLCLAVAAPDAKAANVHLFDPVLSLTGGCATSNADPVPDPGCPGGNHPPQSFDYPCGVEVDAYGNIYVASGPGQETEKYEKGRIDVFNDRGEFLTQVKNENGPCGIAVDSVGTLYVTESKTGGVLIKHTPTTYDPDNDEIAYNPIPTVVASTQSFGVAVDRSNDHVYVAVGSSVREYSSAADGSVLQKTLGLQEGTDCFLGGIDVYDQTHDVYIAGCPGEPQKPLEGRLFVLDGTDSHVKLTLDGSNTPDGSFSFDFAKAGVAVDDTNGDIYVSDLSINKTVYQFDADGDFISQTNHDKFIDNEKWGLALDNSGGPNDGYLYVTSGKTASSSRLFAFSPLNVSPPEIRNEAAEQITSTEALLRGEVNPNGVPTTYRFQYTDEEEFQANGFANATSVPAEEADAGTGGAFATFFEPLTGLEPETAYRFRLVARSNCNPLEPEEECVIEGAGGQFATYPTPTAGLPDGRAYELVTPPDTNGRIPTASVFGTPVGPPGSFETPLPSQDGDGLIFATEAGSLLGMPGNGTYDTYEAVRSAADWQTHYTGLPGDMAMSPAPTGVSADHRYSTWSISSIDPTGTLARDATYLRDPNGNVEVLGKGSLGEYPKAMVKWINADGDHMIFSTGEITGGTSDNNGPAVRLEDSAPPDGTAAVYDRIPGGPARVISLKPGDVPLVTGEHALYKGTSADASAVLFGITSDGNLYLRKDNAATLEIVDGTYQVSERFDWTLAGVSDNGERVFYQTETSEPYTAKSGNPVEITQGQLFACDVGDVGCANPGANAPTQIGGEKSVVVHISEDGSRVYFVSPEQLEGKGQAGAENLYLWDGASVRFIATVDENDVIGEDQGAAGTARGLGQWTLNTVAPFQARWTGPGNVSAHSNPDGSVFLFESRANLTPPEDTGGHRQVYRYDTESEELSCISCSPTGLPATSDARLQPVAALLLTSLPPVNTLSPVDNMTDDGKRVFFEAGDPLVPGDVNGTFDVYEWLVEGTGGCETGGGCLHLISSGRSASASYLYATAGDGRDVFFLTTDRLTPEDPSGTPSIYDARVGGGFPAQVQPQPCQGDACQGSTGADPTMPAPSSATLVGPSDPRPRLKPRCNKRQRKVKRAGKVRCVQKRNKRSSSRGRAAR